MEDSSDEELTPLQRRELRHKELDAIILLRQQMFCLVASLRWKLPEDVLRNITDRMECTMCKCRRMTRDLFFPRV
jgi:hypothetical protein